MRRLLGFPGVCLCLLGLLSALPSSRARARDPDPLPRLIEAAGTAADYPGSGTVLVFDRTRAEVQESGLAYVTRERLWKVLTPGGGVSLRAVVLDYDPQSAMVAFREARLYRRDGTVEPLSLDTVKDYPAPARAIYWGARRRCLPVGRLEEGDALYVKSFRKGFTYALLRGEAEEGESGDERYVPPMKGHFYDIVPFYSSVPVREKQYTAVLPADKPLQYEVYNGTVTVAVHFQKGRTVYTWTKRDIRPRPSEPNQVSPSDVDCKLLLSTAPDWKAKSLWFHKVNEEYGSFEVTPEIRAKVDELLAGIPGDEEKVARLTHWVANEIRYAGITMGEGEGYTLHKGAMTFRDRCGVCKDKAGMLVTMLRAAGFDAYPAMTMAGSRIDPIPADQFNHCVTLVKKAELFPDGPGYEDYRLLDPTWVPFMRELWSSAEQQQNYLPGTPEGSGLRVTPLSPPEKHYFRIHGESELDESGNLEGRFTLRAEGQSDAAVRWNLVRRRQRSMWRSYFDAVIHALSPRAELTNVQYLDPYDLSKPMEVTLTYRIPRYAVAAGKWLIFTPVAARYPFSDTAGFLHVDLGLDKRKHPFRTRTSRMVELEETVTLPEGYRTVRLPEHGDVEGSAAAFHGGYTPEEGLLHFQARLVLRKRVYDPEDYGNFRDAVKGLKKMMNEPVVLGR